jgi:hypothetical protein
MEKFLICNDILAALMQQLNIAKTNDKIIHSVIYLTQSEDVGIKPEAIYYGNLSTKALRHSAIYVLWSLNEYLMEHQQKNTGLSSFCTDSDFIFVTLLNPRYFRFQSSAE